MPSVFYISICFTLSYYLESTIHSFMCEILCPWHTSFCIGLRANLSVGSVLTGMLSLVGDSNSFCQFPASALNFTNESFWDMKEWYQRSGLWGSVLGSVFCSRTHFCYTQRDWLNNQSISIQNEMKYSVFLKVSCSIIFCFECKHF